MLHHLHREAGRAPPAPLLEEHICVERHHLILLAGPPNVLPLSHTLEAMERAYVQQKVFFLTHVLQCIDFNP
jgi:hypothetical protein